MAKEEKKTTEIKFKKEEILRAKRYKKRRDLLEVLLEENKEYSLNEVDKIIEDYLNKEV